MTAQLHAPATGAANDLLISRIANHVVSGHRLVVPRPDGEVEYAEAANPAHERLPVWLTTGAALAGDPVVVLIFGAWTEPSWAWTPDAPLYLGSTGLMTESVPIAPAFLLQVAVAEVAVRVFFEPKMPIRLSA